MIKLESKIPEGPLAEKWTKQKFNLKLVNPANKRKYEVIVVGTGLAGASAAASSAELGYNVKAFCFQDSPRRAHSIAAQGGINAAKNYPNDGDSVYRLFYDTVKGGDFRAREGNVYRLPGGTGNITAHSSRASERHARSRRKSTPAAAAARRRTVSTSTSQSRSSVSGSTSSRSATGT